MTLANLFGLVGFLFLNFVYLYAVLTEASAPSPTKCFIHEGAKMCAKLGGNFVDKELFANAPPICMCADSADTVHVLFAAHRVLQHQLRVLLPLSGACR